MRAIFALTVLILMLPAAYAETVLTDLKVDYQDKPMALEAEQPVFSWRMESDDGLGRQRAYAIEVKSESGAVVWETGRTVSTRSDGIVYAGEPLNPTTRYRWVVRVWREDGEIATGEGRFETGFMVNGDKRFADAHWIGGQSSDLVFRADYFSVFRLGFGVQLDQSSKSEKAALVIGGNDCRLMDSDYNIQGVDNDENESFIALEFDISELSPDGGSAFLNVYRVGYTPDDSRQKPLARLPIPRTLVNARNRYERHSVDVRSLFGLLTIYINGRGEEHRITPFDPSSPPHMPQGLSINPLAFGGRLQPEGNPGDYIV